MPTIDEIKVADEPAAWSALGFQVVEQSCQLGGVMIRFAALGPDSASANGGDRDGRADASTGILGWSLRGLERAELDGLPTALSSTPTRAPATAHPNGVAAIDHVVVVSPAFQRSVDRFVAAGMDLRRVRDEPTPAGAPRQAFFRLGEEIVEMVQEPDEVVAAKGGPERAVRFWGLALLVDDLDATVAAIAPHVSEPRAAVQPGRRIATVRRSAGLSFPLALITRARSEAPAP